MRSKIIGLLAVAISIAFMGCEGTPRDKDEDYIIGEKVKDVSSLTNDLGVILSKVVLYDNAVDMIHQFDLGTGKVEKSYQPAREGGEHAILYHQSGNYVIDMVDKYIGVYNRAGELQPEPIYFEGLPKSAAFHPSSGYLVVYDSTSTVGMLRMDTDGNIVDKWTGGPILDDGVNPSPPSISAGDINDSGQLILGMSDDSISVADLAQSMAQQKWVFTNFATTLTDIRWIAPVRGVPSQVLIRSRGAISILDINTQAILDQKTFTEADTRLKTSKTFDPHVMIIKNNNTEIFYVSGGQILSRSSHQIPRSLLSSRLSLADDSLTWVEAPYQYWFEVDKVNEYRKGRTLLRYRFSDMLSTKRMVLRNEAQLEVTKTHVFELFNSATGYASYTNINSSSRTEFKNFNMPFQWRRK